MNIPSFDVEKIANPDGSPTDKAKAFFDQLVVLLQKNLNNQGYKLPQQTTTIITQLNTAASKGAIIYNSTTDKAMVCENGTFKTITTS